MNFDTKYLIRWGIPGWIMVMALFPYFFFSFYWDNNSSESIGATDLIAVGATLTVLGVPLGYLLNQVHHSMFWVLPKLLKGEWRVYFEQEITADEHLSKSEFMKKRYRYLLSKKHELGGVSVSLCSSALVILITNYKTNNYSWSWIYFAVIFILGALITLSRFYSSKNIEHYFDNYLLEENREKITDD